ncbi:MAG TPA: hypothetical protein VIY72_07570 [Acidimicrobiales bacterium]
MALRCPGCGAKNTEGSIKCRICSHDLRAGTERPLSQPKAGTAVMRSGKLSGVFGLAVLGVLAMVLAGVLLGLLPGGDVITDLRNKVPFLKAEANDGWEEFTDTDGRFRATMPVDRVQEQVTIPSITTEPVDAWTSTLGPDSDPDTELTVEWTTVPVSFGENVAASLNSTAVALADSIGGKVAKNEETSFQGQPALIVRIDGLRNTDGDEITINALLIRSGPDLYLLSSTSVYSDHPQFDRLVNGFALL